MKRRTLLLNGLGLGVVSLAGWRFVRARPEEALAMVVRTRLKYLRLEPQGVLRFARDLAERHVVSVARTRILAEIAPIYTRWDLSSGRNQASYALRHGEDRIAGAYLISSDFFINGADESREVRYLGLLDARRACGNPFARSPI